MTWAWTTPRTWADAEIPTAAIMNAHLRDNMDYLYGLNRTVYKDANEIINNDNTLQNDDDLLFAIAANEVWAFEFVLLILQGTSAAPNFKYAITVPAAASVTYGGTYEISGAVSATDQATTTGGAAMTVDVDSDESKVIVVQCIVINGANAGNVQLQWAQNAATAVNTIVLAGSCLFAHRLL